VALASLVALILVSKRGHSDAYARLIRAEPMNIAAEMQWHLMPPRSYADGRVVIAAAMEPAYRISGDAFDYATAGPVVHLSIFDAMGHDTAAGLSANLAMAACRNSRLQDAGLVEITERIEQALIDQYGQTRYVTGIVADLDTTTGTLTWVNRGHHPPVVIRGGRWISELRCRPAHPMGTRLGLEARLCREQLEPGDRIVCYTDGITEARGAGDTEFGLERFVDFLLRHHADGLPVPETLRRLVHAVLEYHGGRLNDDATVLVCEWLGPDPDTTTEAAARTGLPLP
jgi:serine phosphatase RsbU (regulator of sigma subunit)